jgi:hypothetical protein
MDAERDLDELEAGIREQLAKPDLQAGEQARYTRWLALIGSFRAPMNFDDVSDLPAELLKELNLPSDKLESEIIALLRVVAEPVDLDQILIGLYRRFGVIQKRRFLQNKLWRMVSKEQIHKGKNRKGLYSLEPVKVRTTRPPTVTRRGTRSMASSSFPRTKTT